MYIFEPTRSFAVVVGVDDYRAFDPSGVSDLSGACADAEAMVEMLLGVGYPRENVRLLLARRRAATSAGATRAEIMEALAWLASMLSQTHSSCGFFGFAGHGAMQKGSEHVLCPQDTTRTPRGRAIFIPDSSASTPRLWQTIPLLDVARLLQPFHQRVGVLLDCAFSAAGLEGLQGVRALTPDAKVKPFRPARDGGARWAVHERLSGIEACRPTMITRSELGVALSALMAQRSIWMGTSSTPPEAVARGDALGWLQCAWSALAPLPAPVLAELDPETSSFCEILDVAGVPLGRFVTLPRRHWRPGFPTGALSSAQFPVDLWNWEATPWPDSFKLRISPLEPPEFLKPGEEPSGSGWTADALSAWDVLEAAQFAEGTPVEPQEGASPITYVVSLEDTAGNTPMPVWLQVFIHSGLMTRQVWYATPGHVTWRSYLDWVRGVLKFERISALPDEPESGWWTAMCERQSMDTVG
ncbi:MAG: caspase family protein [Alphaproteobacteria bacterium]|nr:caspase family protein [Alphaproteobacteria bacterium]MCB9797489.1 caspase family protein [Alphaproteobacteria bacterium]